MTTETPPAEMKLPLPLPCPFCGRAPEVAPLMPHLEGNAWGSVTCRNRHCFARPHVTDGEKVSDDRGSDAYKAAAIARWNDRKGDHRAELVEALKEILTIANNPDKTESCGEVILRPDDIADICEKALAEPVTDP